MSEEEFRGMITLLSEKSWVIKEKEIKENFSEIFLWKMINSMKNEIKNLLLQNNFKEKILKIIETSKNNNKKLEEEEFTFKIFFKLFGKQIITKNFYNAIWISKEKIKENNSLLYETKILIFFILYLLNLDNNISIKNTEEFDELFFQYYNNLRIFTWVIATIVDDNFNYHSAKIMWAR